MTTTTISLDDPRATALREWLDERDTRYAEHPVTDAQLCAWLTEAEQSEGIVEIPARHSVSGQPETYSIPLTRWTAEDLVDVRGAGGTYSLYAPGITSDQIESNDVHPLVSGEVEEVEEEDPISGSVRVSQHIPASVYVEALKRLGDDHHVISGVKGRYAGTLLECLEWQATMQDGCPDVDGVDISDLRIAYEDDPARDEDDLTPEEAETVVLERLKAEDL